MPSNAGDVIRQISLLRDNSLSPEALSATLARVARTERDKLISENRTVSPEYRTFVDNREGAREETVRPDGVIRYLFGSDLSQAVQEAFAYMVARSPYEAGTLAKYWIVLVNQKLWTLNLKLIPQNAEVWITNAVPYFRKFETGGMVTSKQPYLVERTRQAFQRRYRRLDFARTFIRLPTGIVTLPNRLGGVPYILQGDAVRSGLMWDKRRRAFIRGDRRRTNASDRRRDAEMTYPALIIKAQT